ncbi:5-hydroxytryptamine receptor 1A-beta-like [Haliotis rubra]|uniref:5-hydroxytryptamine receptor 1A-beta-like n=1 Tax=Haliotis rubra TaxID=36100 RepID=UPI001EE51AF3|nr:5-hydroxytryptamine receptor 1A-beta-like [Haliotis rubra]
MNSSHSQHDLDLYLRHYDSEYAIQSFPVISFLVILMLIGFVGNSLVYYVYLLKFKQSALRCYILALATYDVATCSICIPVEIADIRHNYTFGQYTLCKLLRLMTTFSVIASVIILLAIAVDRYKRICCPFDKQTTPRLAMVTTTVCSITTFIVSLPVAVVNGSRSVPTDDIHVNGSRCTISDDYIDTLFPLIYNGGQFIIFTSCILSLSVLYGLIWRRVARQRKRMDIFTANDLTIGRKIKHKATEQSIAKRGKEDNGSSPRVETNMTSSYSADSNISESTSKIITTESCKSDNTCLHEGTPTLGSQSNRRISTFGRRRSSTFTPSLSDKRSQKTTTMLFLITLVFVLSFLPHLGLMVTRAVNKNVFEDLHGVGFIVYNVFLRSYFINSVSNPILYSFCSVRFRQELIQLWGRVTIRIKK